MVFENNIVEVPTFSDVPDPAEMVPCAQHHLETNWSWVGDPDPIADRNGIGTLAADPASFGPAEDPYDFDYNTDSLAYTHAEGGFPVGDLNWFPDKKAEWETWVDTGVENEQ